jgi:hypothetical protein
MEMMKERQKKFMSEQQVEQVEGQKEEPLCIICKVGEGQEPLQYLCYVKYSNVLMKSMLNSDR